MCVLWKYYVKGISQGKMLNADFTCPKIISLFAVTASLWTHLNRNRKTSKILRRHFFFLFSFSIIFQYIFFFVDHLFELKLKTFVQWSPVYAGVWVCVCVCVPNTLQCGNDKNAFTFNRFLDLSFRLQSVGITHGHCDLYSRVLFVVRVN